jgi:hypothetical protein
MCGKNKLPHKAMAKDLYTSPRFQKSIEYAKTLTDYSCIFILSAKHGILKLEGEIDPYDMSIYKMPIQDKKAWSERVISLLEAVSDPKEDTYVFLTDDFYSENLIPYLVNVELPLKGIPQEEHIHFFTKKLSGIGVS